jgi:uncharacterized membrane protein YbhN (UPF0104 family)
MAGLGALARGCPRRRRHRLILALPRLLGSRPATRFRLARWLSPRTTSLRPASQAWALVSACWIVRAVALVLLLGALGVGYSLPLALLFLCAGAAAAVLPIGPAGTATQVGAHTAALLASGIGASQALNVAVSVGTLGVLSGTAILVLAVAWRTSLSLAHARVAISLSEAIWHTLSRNQPFAPKSATDPPGRPTVPKELRHRSENPNRPCPLY